MNEPEYGVIATSRAGHDKGRAYVIIGRVDEAHVWLADGEARKLANPKKKKLRHLHIEPAKAEEICEKRAKSEPLIDADVRKALLGRGYNMEHDR